MTLGRRRVLELLCSILFGATMVTIDYTHPGSIFGVVGAFGLLLGIVVSGNYLDNPVMISVYVLYWGFLGWLCYRGARLLTHVLGIKSGAKGP